MALVNLANVLTFYVCAACAVSRYEIMNLIGMVLGDLGAPTSRDTSATELNTIHGQDPLRGSLSTFASWCVCSLG